MQAEGVEFVTNVTLAKTSRSKSCGRSSMPCCWRGAPSSRATCTMPGRELKGIHFAMEFLPQQNRRNEGDMIRRRSRFWPPASASSSSAAATPARTASARRTGRGALGAPVRVAAEASAGALAARRRGRSGPCNCAPRPPMKKAACASGAFPPRGSPATRKGNVKKLHGVRVGPPPKFKPIPGHRVRPGGGSGAARHGLHRAGAERPAREPRRDLDGRGNVATDDRT